MQRFSFCQPGRRTLALCAGSALAASLAACDDWRASTGSFTQGTMGGIEIEFGSGRRGAAVLVGSWRRVELFTDADGATHASESTWTFANDGTAALTVVARNLTEGIADVVVRPARWQTEEGRVVVIEYLAPDAGTQVLEYRVDRTADGATLVLGGLVYVQVTP